MIGKTYLEHGRPVVVLKRWADGAGGPRNVLIRRADGTLVVRPFRGLRRAPAQPEGDHMRDLLADYAAEVTRALAERDLPALESRVYTDPATVTEPYIWLVFDADTIRRPYGAAVSWRASVGWVAHDTGPLPVPYLATPADAAQAITERLLGQPPTTSARAAEWDRAGDVRAALPPALHPGQLTNQ